MITKALIIDEPWLTKILNGDKDWEMRSTLSKFRGVFGLIRKGSGQVIGIANLKGISGPYNNAELAHHFNHHQVGCDLTSSPDYKWRHAWELSDIKKLAQPVPYVHKNGAVTWVELDDLAVESIAKQQGYGLNDVPSPKDRVAEGAKVARLAPVSVEVSKVASVNNVKNKPSVNSSVPVQSANSFVPVAKDGSRFTLETCNSKGVYTVGENGDEKKFRNYLDALSYLKTMKTAKWRRPNSSGNWGIVSAVNWEVNN